MSRFSFQRKVYESLPDPVRQAVTWIPFGWIAGRAYRWTLRQTAALDRASAQDIAAFQRQSLGAILQYATKFVPAYQSLRSVVERHEPHEALREFPLLDKDVLIADFERYLSVEFPAQRRWETSTGGTTGEQLKFYLDDDAQSREMAFMHAQWQRVGYHPRCRKGTFRGVEFRGPESDRLWQKNPIYNECQFSPFHLNSHSVDAYVAQLRRYRPRFLHGYPSAIEILARCCQQRGIPLNTLGIRAILLGSEGALPEQRVTIEDAFGARVFTWYGHSERILLAGECEVSTVYHHFPNYGFLEIVDPSGTQVATGESGELVGTGFWNRAMPLIRYRTTDYARKLENTCPCGRRHERFDQVEGHRKQEFVVGRNGSLISLAALNMHGPLFENVLRFQYHQTKPGELTLKLLTGPRFVAEDVVQIQTAYRKKLGSELNVEPVIVPEIPLTGRGKLRRLVQDIPAKDQSLHTSQNDPTEIDLPRQTSP